MRCLLLSWRFFVGLFNFGWAKYLASVWGMYHCFCGCGIGTPKPVRRAGSHGPSRRGRIVTERSCLDRLRPKTCERATIYSLEEVLGGKKSSWRSWVRHLGDSRRWPSLRRGGSGACYARHIRMQFSFWWGRWRSVGTALRYATAFQDAAVPGPVLLPAEAVAGGATRVLTHLVVWAPKMYPAQAEPLSQRHSSPLPGLRSCWTLPLYLKPLAGGGLVLPQGQGSQALPPPFALLPPVAQRPRDPTGGGGFVTVDSSDSFGSQEGGGDGRNSPDGLRPTLTLGAHVQLPVSRSTFRGRRREGGRTGDTTG